MNNLRELRKRQHLTLMGLAKRVGMGMSTLTFIERYDHVPGPELRRRIAEAVAADETDIWPELAKGERRPALVR